MIPNPSGLTPSEALRFGAAVLLAAAIAFAAICVAWTDDFRTPRVTLLGSGDGAVSVLVTAGLSRLLIATGDDPSAFATALERARRPIARRLDVVLAAGEGHTLLAPGAIAADPGIRYLATLGVPPPSPEADALRAGGLDALTTGKRIQLDEQTVVDLDLATNVDGRAEAWRAVIRRQATAVVVLSDAAAAERFDWPGPVSALVVSAGKDPLPAWKAVPAPLLAFPDEAITGDALREGFAAGSQPEWIGRVFPGEAIRLTFGSSGLELASTAVVPLGGPVSSERRRGFAAGRGRTPP